MKITKTTVWWKFTCRICKAKIEAEPEDVTGRPNIDSDGDTVGTIPIVACGNCGAERDVPFRLRTPKIESLADSRCRK